MTQLRDQIKDAMLSIENDEKKWNDFTLVQVAQAVHDQVAVQLQAQIAQLQTQADPAMAQTIADLQTKLDATAAELAKHEADTTESDKIAAMQAELDDTNGALTDFFAALKTGMTPEDAIAQLQAATAATGNGAGATATNTGGTDASGAASAGAGATDTGAAAGSGN